MIQLMPVFGNATTTDTVVQAAAAAAAGIHNDTTITATDPDNATATIVQVLKERRRRKNVILCKVRGNNQRCSTNPVTATTISNSNNQIQKKRENDSLKDSSNPAPTKS